MTNNYIYKRISEHKNNAVGTNNLQVMYSKLYNGHSWMATQHSPRLSCPATRTWQFDYQNWCHQHRWRPSDQLGYSVSWHHNINNIHVGTCSSLTVLAGSV